MWRAVGSRWMRVLTKNSCTVLHLLHSGSFLKICSVHVCFAAHRQRQCTCEVSCFSEPYQILWLVCRMTSVSPSSSECLFCTTLGLCSSPTLMADVDQRRVGRAATSWHTAWHAACHATSPTSTNGSLAPCSGVDAGS